MFKYLSIENSVLKIYVKNVSLALFTKEHE